MQRSHFLLKTGANSLFPKARWGRKASDEFAVPLLGVDKAHKLIRKWDATDAAVHDSQKLDDVLDLSNTGTELWADSAYRSVQIEAGLKEKGLQSRIHRRAARNRPLLGRQRSANTTRSKVRPCRACLWPAAELDGWQDCVFGTGSSSLARVTADAMELRLSSRSPVTFCPARGIENRKRECVWLWPKSRKWISCGSSKRASSRCAAGRCNRP